MKKIAGFIAVFLCLVGVSHAANQPKSYGNININGITEYTPANQTVSSVTTISPTSSIIVIESTGNNVNLAGSGGIGPSIPAIATGTALNGQYLILMSTNPSFSSTVTISSGATTGVHLGAATRLVGQNSVLTLIYNSVLSMWQEVSYGSN